METTAEQKNEIIRSDMLAAYIECALWSSTDNSRDDGGDPLDDNYTGSDLDMETVKEMVSDCADFVQGLPEELREKVESNPKQAGHDFWLTRNGHGAGFWDRPEIWGKGDCDRLADAARIYGGVDLIVGDDGKIYG
jgi:hypothetical protein